MKVLISGFDPFSKEKINPSWEAVKRIDLKRPDVEIDKIQIPTVFNKSIEIIEKKMLEKDYDIVIGVGQAGGRTKVSLERIAINIDDARIEDNEGNSPVDRTIDKNGKNAYFSSLPLKEILEELKRNKIPGEISNTAGTFVCNHLMYGILNTIDKYSLKAIGGFIHLPYLPSQVVDKGNIGSLPIDMDIEALEIGIDVSLKYLKEKPIK